MKPSTVVLTALVAAVFLVGFSEAWGFRRQLRKSGVTGRGSWSPSNSTRSSRTYILVRRVDEPHPYFRTLNVSSNSSLVDLKTSLGEFFNKSAENITMLVLNDKLLLTLDAEARMLKSKDQLEVTFSDSGAPTRAKTQYAYSKDARKKWSDNKEKKDKKEKKGKVRGRPENSGGRGRPERRRRPANSEAEDEADEAMLMDELEF